MTRTVPFTDSLAFIDELTREAGSTGLEVIDPATGRSIGAVPCARPENLASALQSSHADFGRWSAATARERSRALARIGSLLRARSPELERLLTMEQGKPLAEAAAEIEYGASYFEWFSGEALRSYGETIPAWTPDRAHLVLREPLGVAALITPWNFPHAMLARKMAAALAAGCTVVAKPAEETPFSAFALARIAEEAGVPRDAVRVLAGDPEAIGQAFLASPLVKKLSFTGSTEVGKLLMRGSAETVKKLTLELGGNAPLLVFEDADLEAAVEGAIYAKYRNAGQTCVAVNRFLVHEGIAEPFIRRFTEESRKLVVGSGLDPSTDIGPLISRRAVEKAQGIIDDALERGARAALGGAPTRDGSLLVPPTILVDLPRSARAWREEVFGPVASFWTFSNDDEALEFANDASTGLVSYFYTRDLQRLQRFSRSLESGMVGVNDTRISVPQAPFGGMKESGFGREGGRYGMEEYQTLKFVSVRF